MFDVLQLTDKIWLPYTVAWGHAVAQLVQALRYKPEGRGFDSRWGFLPLKRVLVVFTFVISFLLILFLYF